MQRRPLAVILALILIVQTLPSIAMASEIDADISLRFNAEAGIIEEEIDPDISPERNAEADPAEEEAGSDVPLEASLEADVTEEEFSSEPNLTSFATSSTPWNGTTESEPGTDNNGAYQIGTAEELAWFRTYVNNTARCAADAVLTSDIDLNNQNWTPISMQSAVADTYTGTFDGQFHTVSGLWVSGTTANQGFFADINGATIKNLMLAGSVSGSSNYVGGIVGTTRNATIENCSFSGSVTYTGTGSHYIGGIVGGNQTTASTIRNCVNMADVSGYTAGGILGYSTQANTIESCYTTGTITGTFRSGGIVGQATTGTIKNCYNNGIIAGASSTPGGIYSFSNATITSCYHLYPEAETPGGSPAGKSTKIESPEGLLALLDSAAFVDDTGGVNNGYPLLVWQTPADTISSISLSGDTTIYVQTGAGVNATTLSIGLKDIDPDDIDTVTWNVETAKGNPEARNIAGWQTAENDETQLIITAKSGGVVTVSVTVEAYGDTLTATRDVSVVPQITTAEIRSTNDPGAVAIGQTVQVSVFVLDGVEYDYDNYPDLTYEWRYNSTSSAANIPGATARTFEIPTTSGYAEWDSLYVEIKSGGAVVKEASDVRGQLRSADYGILHPVAYDPAFTLPDKVRDNNPLTLPSTHTVGGITANITWSSNNAAINASSGAVARPASGAVTVTLTARCEYGMAFANTMFDITVYSDEGAANETNKSYLEEAAESLGQWYGPLIPVYGSDTNIAAMLKADLTANGYDDLTVAVKSVTEVYDGGAIAPNGNVTYFYADPNGSRALWFGQYRVTFTLAKGTDLLDIKDLVVNLYWDADKVEETMRGEILSGVTETIVLGENEDRDNVLSNLVLPKVVGDKRWTQIEWTSSDPSAISVNTENQDTADTLLNTYVGKVIRGEEDKDVTLTAKFIFRRTAANEPEIVLYHAFTVTVKALAGTEADAIRAELLQKLNAGFDSEGLRDYVTGQRLTETNDVYSTVNDIQLPTTRDFGVDGKYFPVTILSSNNDTIAAPGVVNAARVMVYRPPVGGSSKTVTLTVSITDAERGVSASKKFAIAVLPLTQMEIDDALNLMDRVKTGYFDGLNDGRYADDFSVTGGLHSFQEAVWNDTRTGINWVYDSRESTKNGIIADELKNWAEQEAWRAFRSSDMTVLDHETLNYVAQPDEDTFVRISSTLTHEVYGKYWAMYAGKPGYEAFEQLYKQSVSVYVMVAGKNHQTRTREELEQMRDEAIAKINVPISAGFTLFGTRPQAPMRAVTSASSEETLIETTVSGLEAGSTVFELFRKVLAQKGYTYKAVGSYVKSVTDANGNTLSERDGGPNSGWIYTVNGQMPSIYMNGFSLKEGDKVVIRFTNDYTQEDGMPDVANPSTPTDGSSSGGSGSGGGRISSSLSATPTPLTSSAAASATRNATTNANGVLTPSFQDISEVSKAVFDMMVKTAKGKPVETRFDSMNGRAVDVRLYINPAVVTGDLNVAASTTSAVAKSTKNLFEKFFSNKVAVISFQQGSFGTAIKVAAKVDLTGMDTKNLVFYSYNKASNSYRAIPAADYWIDANGYVRFATALAGDIVISDEALAPKR